jgi:hypothetical protein
MKDENEASLTATVLSQHFALEKGMELGQKNLLLAALCRRSVDPSLRMRFIYTDNSYLL